MAYNPNWHKRARARLIRKYEEQMRPEDVKMAHEMVKDINAWMRRMEKKHNLSYTGMLKLREQLLQQLFGDSSNSGDTTTERRETIH